MRKEKEWVEDCMEEDSQGRQGAEEIQDKRVKTRAVERKKQNTQYWLKAAENLLDSDTPQAAMILGYFAAESKVEQALAKQNIKVNTHICAIKGLSRVLEKPDQAKQLQKAYQKRKEINYETQLGENKEKPKQFIQDTIKPIIQSLEE